MKNHPKLIIISVFCFALYAFTACNNVPKSAQGKDVASHYRTYCSGCHGENIDRFSHKPWMDEPGTTAIEKNIKYGIESSGMPAFEKTFNDSEINRLAVYVKNGIPEDRSKLKPAVTPKGVINSEEYTFVIDTVVTGLDVPWGLEFLPNGDLLISERAGTLHTFSNGKLSTPIQGLPPIMAGGQGGLMDLVLHPNYAQNGWIYISYSAIDTESGSRIGSTGVMRAKLEANILVNQEILFIGTPATNRTHHWGCKLAFDKNEYLFFGVGERGQHFEFAQSLDNTNGKIHRIHDDGRIPTDNPFVDTPGAIKSIYSYGIRNPQGTDIHPTTGEVWETEHGPMGGDEINLIEPGKNYGWPIISYGIDYNGLPIAEGTEKEGMEQPVYQWTPSIAPCGMTFVTGDKFKKWNNNILVGSLKFDYVERVVIEGHKVVHTEKLAEGIGRVRNVVMSPDGLVYIGLEEPGMIVRLVPIE